VTIAARRNAQNVTLQNIRNAVSVRAIFSTSCQAVSSVILSRMPRVFYRVRAAEYSRRVKSTNVTIVSFHLIRHWLSCSAVRSVHNACPLDLLIAFVIRVVRIFRSSISRCGAVPRGERLEKMSTHNSLLHNLSTEQGCQGRPGPEIARFIFRCVAHRVTSLAAWRLDFRPRSPCMRARVRAGLRVIARVINLPR